MKGTKCSRCEKSKSFKKYIVNGITYKIVDEGSKKEQVESAKRLHRMNGFAIRIIRFMREYLDYYKNGDGKYKRPPEVDLDRLNAAWNRLRKNYNIDKIYEVPHGKGRESFVRNLGEEVHYCFRRDPEVVALAVLVHELAHIISYNSEHDEAFWGNFRFMCKIVKLGGFIPYNKVPKTGGYHCGKVLVPHSEISLMACESSKNALGENLIGMRPESGYRVYKMPPKEIQIRYLQPGRAVYSIPGPIQMHYNATLDNYRMGYGRMSPSSPFSGNRRTPNSYSSFTPYDLGSSGTISRGVFLPNERQKKLPLGPADLLQPTVKADDPVSKDMIKKLRKLNPSLVADPFYKSEITAKIGPPVIGKPIDTPVLRNLKAKYHSKPDELYSSDLEILSLDPPYKALQEPHRADNKWLVVPTHQNKPPSKKGESSKPVRKTPPKKAVVALYRRRVEPCRKIGNSRAPANPGIRINEKTYPSTEADAAMHQRLKTILDFRSYYVTQAEGEVDNALMEGLTSQPSHGSSQLYTVDGPGFDDGRGVFAPGKLLDDSGNWILQTMGRKARCVIPKSHEVKSVAGIGHKSNIRYQPFSGYRSNPFYPPDIRRLYDPNI